MFGQSVAVFLVMLLLAVFLWTMRRRGVASFGFALTKSLAKQKLMHVIERVPLTASHSLHLVRINDRMIVISVSPSGCAQIDSFAASGPKMPFEEQA